MFLYVDHQNVAGSFGLYFVNIWFAALNRKAIYYPVYVGGKVDKPQNPRTMMNPQKV